METVKVAIIGLGTVGSGVARLLLEHDDRLSRHSGRKIQLVRAVVRDPKKPRQYEIASEIITNDLKSVIDDPEIKIVAQLIGGIEPARSIMLDLLAGGKDIVTANKALLAEHGPELFDKARQLGRCIAMEASVAGGIPIIANIGQCLTANQILSLQGILNGTSNFIVSQMEEHGADYASAVAEAQRLGYAEADPAMDVDGTDAAQKLAILAQLAFGANVHWSEIPRNGIDNLDPCDLKYAGELGYRIKLLAVGQLTDGALELHVSPTLVKNGRPLAEVREAFNAVSVVGDAIGRTFFHGLGAGRMPTASAVVADLIDMAVGRAQLTFSTLQLWSEKQASIPLCKHADVPGRYYLRFTVDDHPGVLAQISGALGKYQISIASLIQHEPDENGEKNTVPLVVMTHTATEGAVQAAIEEINTLEPIRSQSVRMRVLN